MLHRVTNVQHFSRLGIHRALGSVLPQESWGRGGGGDGRGRKAGGITEHRSRAGAGSTRDAALATCVPPCVGFFAFFISLSSVN